MDDRRRNPEASGDERGLNEGEMSVLRACAEALLPAGGAISLSGVDAGVVAYFDQLIARVPATTRVLLRVLIGFVEYSPWMFGPFKAQMTRLSLADRMKVIQGLSESRIYLLRTAFVALRTVLTIAYFGNAEVNRSIGVVTELDPFHLGGVAG
jgi:hypothetical protein